MSGYEFEGVDSHEEAVRISGRVKWFDAGKGYGFIVPDDPSQTGLKDVLLHVTSLRNSGRESALEGAVIVCDVIRRPKGWQVAEVVEVDESSAPAPSDRRRDEGHGGFRRDSYDRGGYDRGGSCFNILGDLEIGCRDVVGRRRDSFRYRRSVIG